MLFVRVAIYRKVALNPNFNEVKTIATIYLKNFKEQEKIAF